MKYYVNKNAQPNGDHEVHEATCDHCPSTENRIYLGEFTNCHDFQLRICALRYLISNSRTYRS